MAFLNVLILFGVSLITMFITGHIAFFIDIPTLVVVVLPAIFFGLTSTSWNDAMVALRWLYSPIEADEIEHKDAVIHFWRVVSQSALWLGLLMTLISFIAWLTHMGESLKHQQLGSAFALVLLPLMYGVFLRIMAFLAAQRLRFKLSNYQS